MAPVLPPIPTNSQFPAGLVSLRRRRPGHLLRCHRSLRARPRFPRRQVRSPRHRSPPRRRRGAGGGLDSRSTPPPPLRPEKRARPRQGCLALSNPTPGPRRFLHGHARWHNLGSNPRALNGKARPHNVPGRGPQFPARPAPACCTRRSGRAARARSRRSCRKGAGSGGGRCARGRPGRQDLPHEVAGAFDARVVERHHEAPVGAVEGPVGPSPSRW